MEVIVRLAKAKYLDSKKCGNYAEALKTLITYLKKNTVDNWQAFRNAKLWTIEVNDLLKPNEENLEIIYKKFFTPQKKCMDIDDFNAIFMDKTELLKNIEEVRYCAGVSKMSMTKEREDAEKYYNNWDFVEFLESLGRVAEFLFPSTEPQYKDMAFVEKLYTVLEKVLETIKKKVIEPEIVVVDESESDDDY